MLTIWWSFASKDTAKLLLHELSSESDVNGCLAFPPVFSLLLCQKKKFLLQCFNIQHSAHIQQGNWINFVKYLFKYLLLIKISGKTNVTEERAKRIHIFMLQCVWHHSVADRQQRSGLKHYKILLFSPYRCQFMQCFKQVNPCSWALNQVSVFKSKHIKVSPAETPAVKQIENQIQNCFL